MLTTGRLRIRKNKIKKGGLDMPDRITTYEQAFCLINVKINDRIRNLLSRLSSEGRSEKSISFAIWKSKEKIMKFKHDQRFYSVLENEIKKWSWSNSDPRWKDYNRRKEEELKAATIQRKEEEKRMREIEYKKRCPGFIYFVQGESGGPIKIGFATDVKKRLASLQTGYPETLILLHSIPGNVKDEEYFHSKFMCFRLRGEWFRPCDDILSLTSDLKRKN
jgi:hypothetical protein